MGGEDDDNDYEKMVLDVSLTYMQNGLEYQLHTALDWNSCDLYCSTEVKNKLRDILQDMKKQGLQFDSHTLNLEKRLTLTT